MPIIELHTLIAAKPPLVFDLSRSIELHKESTRHTNEEAIAGKMEGLLNLNDIVTWRARHFGIYLSLTSKITEFYPCQFFTDEMVKGPFKSFVHQHIFKKVGSSTEMIDVFKYKSPLGLFGTTADILFLKYYMKKLLLLRNQTIKTFAESEEWKKIV